VPLIACGFDLATKMQSVVEESQSPPLCLLVGIVLADERLDLLGEQPLIDVRRLAARILALRTVRRFRRTVMFWVPDAVVAMVPLARIVRAEGSPAGSASPIAFFADWRSRGSRAPPSTRAGL